MIKLLISEEGSELAEKLWASAYPAVSSALAYPEGRAALAMALRSDRLSRQSHKHSIGQFEELHGELVSIGVDRQLAWEAGRCATTFGLRGCDSVHLATALDFDEELILVTWDARLGHAAASAGLPIAGAAGW